MARIRTIKPEFWTSEEIVECSTNARLMFIGMWNFCDDAGIHPASPKTIKMEIFPGDDFSVDDIKGFLKELMDQGLIQYYVVGKKAYFQVTGWHHQKIDKPTYKYPGPEKATENPPPSSDPSTTPRRPLDEPSPPEGSLRESKGSNTVSPFGKTSLDQRFEEFWQVVKSVGWHGNIGSKQEAKKKFIKLKPDDLLISQILESIKRNLQVVKSNAEINSAHFEQTWKNLSGWLSNRCWEDDPPPTAQPRAPNPKPHDSVVPFKPNDFPMEG